MKIIYELLFPMGWREVPRETWETRGYVGYERRVRRVEDRPDAEPEEEEE